MIRVVKEGVQTFQERRAKRPVRYKGLNPYRPLERKWMELYDSLPDKRSQRYIRIPLVAFKSCPINNPYTGENITRNDSVRFGIAAMSGRCRGPQRMREYLHAASCPDSFVEAYVTWVRGIANSARLINQSPLVVLRDKPAMYLRKTIDTDANLVHCMVLLARAFDGYPAGVKIKTTDNWSALGALLKAGAIHTDSEYYFLLL